MATRNDFNRHYAPMVRITGVLIDNNVFKELIVNKLFFDQTIKNKQETYGKLF